MIIVNSTLKKLKELLYIIRFCFKVSWKASKKYVVIRSVIEITVSGIPFVTITLSKELINFLAAVPGMKVDVSESLYNLILLLSIVLFLKIVSRFTNRIKDYCGGVHKDLISREIDTQIAEQSAALDLSYFDSAKFYNEMNNARRDSSALQTLTWLVMDVIRSSIQFVVSLIVLLKLNTIFALLLIATGIPSIISERKFTEVIYRWQRNHVPEERKMGYIMGILTGRGFAKDVRLYNIQKELLSRYNSMWDKWFKDKRDTTFERSKWVMLFSALPEFGVIVISLYVGIEIMHGRLTIGDYSLYTGMVGQLMGGLFMIILLTSNIYDNNLRIVNYNNFLKWESNIKDTGTIIPEPPMEISFVHVAFKYPGTDEYILKNVSFTMSQNEKVALVGLNGAGKSTIVKLILRYYDPTEGEILVNGTNLKEYDLKAYRKLFSVMFQDYANYAFTIEENITLSNLDNRDNLEKIKMACDKSGAQSVADKYETGLDTYLTRQFEEDGKELSGGEWQKIALARTFFREGDIIILDEPSARLDPEAEHQIFTKFAELCEGKGAIFISHRLSNVTMADRIIVLDDGKVIEDGSHKKLMELKGKYSYLFNLQAEKYKVG